MLDPPSPGWKPSDACITTDCTAFAIVLQPGDLGLDCTKRCNIVSGYCLGALAASSRCCYCDIATKHVWRACACVFAFCLDRLDALSHMLQTACWKLTMHVHAIAGIFVTKLSWRRTRYPQDKVFWHAAALARISAPGPPKPRSSQSIRYPSNIPRCRSQPLYCRQHAEMELPPFLRSPKMKCCRDKATNITRRQSAIIDPFRPQHHPCDIRQITCGSPCRVAVEMQRGRLRSGGPLVHPAKVFYCRRGYESSCHQQQICGEGHNVLNVPLEMVIYIAMHRMTAPSLPICYEARKTRQRARLLPPAGTVKPRLGNFRHVPSVLSSFLHLTLRATTPPLHRLSHSHCESVPAFPCASVAFNRHHLLRPSRVHIKQLSLARARVAK